MNTGMPHRASPLAEHDASTGEEGACERGDGRVPALGIHRDDQDARRCRGPHLRVEPRNVRLVGRATPSAS